jgi:hypothetical protein
MTLLGGVCREVLEATEFVAMVTAGPKGLTSRRRGATTSASWGSRAIAWSSPRATIARWRRIWSMILRSSFW